MWLINFNLNVLLLSLWLNHPYLPCPQLGTSTSRVEVQELNEQGLLRKNFNRPTLWDTVYVPHGGYTVVRMHTNVPGKKKLRLCFFTNLFILPWLLGAETSFCVSICFIKKLWKALNRQVPWTALKEFWKKKSHFVFELRTDMKIFFPKSPRPNFWKRRNPPVGLKHEFCATWLAKSLT